MDFFLFLSYHVHICMLYVLIRIVSLEPPHRGDSDEYTKHIVKIEIENTSLKYSHLRIDLAL